MNWSLSFSDWSTPLLACGAVILAISTCISLYLATKRLKNKPIRCVLVILLNVTASLALIGLIADIIVSNKHVSQAWLVTKGGYSVAKNTLSQINPHTTSQLFILSNALPETAQDKSGFNVISDPSQLLDWQPDLQQLTVLGDGLSPTQWRDIQSQKHDIKISFIPAQKSTGLIDMSWTKSLVQGDYFTISGRLQIADGDDSNNSLYELSLLDPVQQKLAKTTLLAGERFSFTATAKTVGNWLYELQLDDENQQMLASESLPVAVQKGKPVNLLIVQSAPSFETRNMKDWMINFANTVTVVSQISKNKYLSQRYNYPENTNETKVSKTLQNLNDIQLEDFDLLVMDGRAVSRLTEQESERLQRHITKGLGVIILADQSLLSALQEHKPNWLNKLELQAPISSITDTTSIPQWPNSSIAQPLQVQNMSIAMPSAEVLVRDQRQQALVTAIQSGMGKVAISLINTSYQWQTSGNSSQYSQYWQYLVRQLARFSGLAYWQTQLPDDLLLTNQMELVCAISRADKLKAEISILAHEQTKPLALSAKLTQSEQFCTTFWPRNNGWLELNLLNPKNQTTLLIDQQARYVFSQQQWLAWQQQQKLLSSALAAKRSEVLPVPGLMESQYTVDKLWSWFVFIICCSALWIERKRF